MKRKTISTVIILGVISLISILIVQYFWIQTSIAAQAKRVEIQVKEDSLDMKHFTELVFPSGMYCRKFRAMLRTVRTFMAP